MALLQGEVGIRTNQRSQRSMKVDNLLGRTEVDFCEKTGSAKGITAVPSLFHLRDYLNLLIIAETIKFLNRLNRFQPIRNHDRLFTDEQFVTLQSLAKIGYLLEFVNSVLEDLRKLRQPLIVFGKSSAFLVPPLLNVCFHFSPFLGVSGIKENMAVNYRAIDAAAYNILPNL